MNVKERTRRNIIIDKAPIGFVSKPGMIFSRNEGFSLAEGANVGHNIA